jgi:glycosyltransferase involved in cell wall biosynthesis
VFEICIDCREIVRDRKTGLSRCLVSFLKNVSKNKKSSLIIADNTTDTDFLKEIFEGNKFDNKFDFIFLKRSGAFYDQIFIPLAIFGKTKRFFSIYPKFPIILPFLRTEVFIFVADLIDFSWYQLAFLKVFGRLPKKIFTLTDTSKYKIQRLVKREVIRVYQDLSYIIESEKILSSNYEILREKGIEPGKFILYVGNFNPHKNVGTLVEAFSLIEDKLDLKLVLAGGGGRKAQRISETDKIKILENIDENILRWLYKNSIFFVFPSLDEGQGIPPLEACCFGKAVIVSDIPVFRETLGRCAIFFDPKSPKDLAEKILLLYKNETLRKELEAKSKEVAKFFTSFDFGEKIFEYIFSE